MANKDIIYQTMGEFLSSPFGIQEKNPKQDEYEKKYLELVRGKKIYCENWTLQDKSYLIHIKIPSESQQGLFYDVVVQFFTDDKKIENQMNIGRYYVQFFSNSPSFIYQYSSLYRLYGYLIDALYMKTDEEYAHQMPDKVNSDYKLSFDKSIYYACRFIQDHELTMLRKNGIVLYPKVNMSRMLKTIKDFSTVKNDSELYKLEADLKKETDKEKLEAKDKRQKTINKINPFSRNRSDSIQRKKKAGHDTLGENSPHAIHITKKRKPVRSTVTSKDSLGNIQRGVKVVRKKKAGYSTKKK